MLTKADYGDAVSHFLRDLSLITLSQKKERLQEMEGFLEEVNEAVRTICAGNVEPNEVLATAFGLVDEFVSRTWDQCVAEAYASYCAEHRDPADLRSRDCEP